jgi:hypothetical protein
MARPPIQAKVIEDEEFDTERRHWRMTLFHEDGTPFTGDGVQGPEGPEGPEGPAGADGGIEPFLPLPDGFIAESLPRWTTMTSQAHLTSGRLCLTAIKLKEGDVINNIAVFNGGTAAGTPTNQWFCLIRASDRAVLGKTADDGAAAWNTNVVKSLALAAPVTIDEDGLYYIGVVVVAAIVPTPIGTSGLISLMGATPPLSALADTGLTNPASLGANAAALTAAGKQFYARVS